MRTRPKSSGNLPSRVSAASDLRSFLEQAIGDTQDFRRPAKISSARWRLEQSLAEESVEPKVESENLPIDNLVLELRNLQSEMKRHSDLVRISNDLMLELNATLKIQESQSYFWTPSWIDGEQRADEDIKNNRVHTFESAQQIIRFLRQPE